MSSGEPRSAKPTPNENSAVTRVFDAAPLVAVLLGEPGGLAVRGALTERSGRAISAVNAAEVADAVARLAGVSHGDVLSKIDLWLDDGVVVEPVDWRLATRASELRTHHYHRRHAPVSIADCCALALAERLEAELVTSDRPLLNIAEQIGVATLPVPNSAGTLPK